MRQYLKTQTGLTPREVDVVAGLISGRDSKSIGHLLHISHHTIRNHIQSIYSKLNCNTQQTLIVLLEQQGIHELFRRYYLYLQLQPLFKRWLHDIAQNHGDGAPTLLSIHPDKHGDSPSPYITLIEGHLKAAGFEVMDVDSKDVSNQLARRTFTHVVAWYISEISERDDRDAMWLNITTGGSQSSSIESNQSVDLKNHQDFYSVMVALLQILTPKHNATTFQQTYQRVMGQALSNTLPISLDTEPARRTVSRWRFIMLGLSMLVIFAIVGYAWWWYQPHVAHQDSSNTWNLPPLMSYYTERSELTNQIWQQLQQEPGKGTVSLVGLRGMGGVGKTTLALEAIHYPKQPYTFRGWFKAENPELLKADYLDLGRKMHLFTQQMSEKQKLIAVKEWLQSQPSALLVYDNAPDMNTIRSFIPNRGHILITSRNNHMPCPVDIEGMETKEAITLLNKLIPDTLKQQECYQEHLETLTEELSYLPLALTQAGAYMNEHQLLIPEYLQRYQKLQVQVLAQHTLPPQDPHEPIYLTWDMNIQAIQKHPRGQAAIQLLDVVAYLYPENIPKVLLAQYLFQSTDENTITHVETLIGLLKNYSLVKSSSDHISIHRLVHAYLHYRHQNRNIPIILKKVIHSMLILHRMDSQDFKLIKSMIPHTEYLKYHKARSLTKQQLLQLDTILAWLYCLSGRLTQAKHLCQQMLPTSLQLHGAAHPKTAEIYRSLGWVYLDLEQPREAKIWFEKALPIFQKNHGTQHVWTGWIYRGLGWVYLDLGQPLEAKIWFEKALPIFQKHYGKQHAWSARVYRDLGSMYRDLGQPLEAKTWFEKALPIFQKHYGEQHIWTAWVCQNLGSMYHELGQPLEAKTWFEKTLAIVQKHHRAQHVWTVRARVYQGLGWVYRDLGQPLEAKAWFEKALAIFQKHYGEQHIWTARGYRDLGWVYREMGQPMKAKVWLEKALVIHQKHYGEQHVRTAWVYRGLGWIYIDLKQPLQSKIWFKRALSIVEKYYGESHARTARVYQGLGWVEIDLNHPVQAKQWFKKALPTYQAHYGQNHLRTAQVYDGLGWAELQLGASKQALPWFKQALAIRQQHDYSQHVRILPTYHGLAWMYCKLRQLESAKTYLEQAQQIIRQHQKKEYQFNQKLHQSLAQLQQELTHSTGQSTQPTG